MLKKIISIKNVGRFRNSAASGNPQLAKHTFIAGANGYGKTTLCAVLRSLQTGDPAHVLGRKTLGAVDAPAIELLLEGGQARFDGTAWNAIRRIMQPSAVRRSSRGCGAAEPFALQAAT